MDPSELILSDHNGEIFRVSLSKISDGEWFSVGDSHLCDHYCSLIAPDENLQFCKFDDFIALRSPHGTTFGFRTAECCLRRRRKVAAQLQVQNMNCVRSYVMERFPNFFHLYGQNEYEEIKAKVLVHFDSQWLSRSLDFALLSDVASKVSMLSLGAVSDSWKTSLALFADVFLEGALSGVLANADISEVACNGDGLLWFEKKGTWSTMQLPFASWDAFERWLIFQSSRANAELYREKHFSDFVLRCGARVHVSFPPAARSRAYVTIRSHAPCLRDLSTNDFSFQKEGSCTLLLTALEQRKNILIVGSTGSGKTTLMRYLLERAGIIERIVVLEDTPELRIVHPHVVYLQTCEHAGEHSPAVTLAELVRESLRMRPDRIVVGECRGPEAFALLQALHTGHRGTLCTLHASSFADALNRFQTLVLQAQPSLSVELVERMILSSIDVVVVLDRDANGLRSVADVRYLSEHQCK